MKKKQMKPRIVKRMMMAVATIICTCKKCPSYPRCSGGKCDKVLYCGKGASSKKINKKGCICGTCKVYKMKKLTENYYCVRGVAKENKK
jgi:hypothetical protein